MGFGWIVMVSRGGVGLVERDNRSVQRALNIPIGSVGHIVPFVDGRWLVESLVVSTQFYVMGQLLVVHYHESRCLSHVLRCLGNNTRDKWSTILSPLSLAHLHSAL